LVKKGKLRMSGGKEDINMDHIPHGIIAHLTRECGGNVHDRHVVSVTSRSFEKETHEANPHSGVYDNGPKFAAKNVTDLESDLRFRSAYRNKEDIRHTRNNWVCYDFKEKRTVPTHYTIRATFMGPGGAPLTSWIVETSGTGGRPRGEQGAAQGQQVYRHICGCGCG
jgi:hypothetical protein